MARFHGGEKQSRVQTLQKPKMKESKYISSDYHKEVTQKEPASMSKWNKALRTAVLIMSMAHLV